MMKSQHVLMTTIAPDNITLGLNRTEKEKCNCCLFYGIMVVWSYKMENFMQHNHVYHYEDIKLWPQHLQSPFEYKDRVLRYRNFLVHLVFNTWDPYTDKFLLKRPHAMRERCKLIIFICSDSHHNFSAQIGVSWILMPNCYFHSWHPKCICFSRLSFGIQDT